MSAIHMWVKSAQLTNIVLDSTCVFGPWVPGKPCRMLAALAMIKCEGGIARKGRIEREGGIERKGGIERVGAGETRAELAGYRW
jgi:hypothetical protein